jgi:hypothetical protein
MKVIETAKIIAAKTRFLGPLPAVLLPAVLTSVMPPLRLAVVGRTV